jgi:hypothetical protein
VYEAQTSICGELTKHRPVEGAAVARSPIPGYIVEAIFAAGLLPGLWMS